MRSLSALWSGSSSAWTPVTNSDEHDMDDLIRMSMGHYDFDNHNHINDSITRNEDNHMEPVFHRSEGEFSQSSSTNGLSAQFCSLRSDENSRGLSSRNCDAKLSFPKRCWYLILLSLFIVITFASLNVGLGCYSLFFYKPDKLVIDKSVKSFSIPNHKAYLNFEAFMLARKDSSPRYKRDTGSVSKPLGRFKKDVSSSEKKRLLANSKDIQTVKFKVGTSFQNVLQRLKRSTHELQCLFEYQSIARWKMHVIYLANGDTDSNIFTRERLETVHQIEKQIMEHPGFHNFCLRDPNMERYDPAIQNMNGCVPLNSLLTYFYPSKDSDGRIIYDGMGKNIDNVPNALKLAMNHETFYYYVDDKINKTYQKSHLLRSEVLFGAPLPGFSCVGDQRKDQDDKFRNFVITYIDMLSKASTESVQVLYGGNEIFDYEVSSSFWSDVRLAIISFFAIFILMLVLSLSLYLTIVGTVVIALSFPISLYFYRVIFGINALGILNGAAAFIIIGIGVDDVFVFVNTYRQSSHMDPVARVKYTIKTAGVATFFTSFTTAAAFAANLTSSIPAVYEFGLFMSLIVSSCWVSVIILMPPLLYLHACYIEPVEQFLFSCFSFCKLQDSHQDRTALVSYSEQLETEGRLYEDDDVPMLNVDITGDENAQDDYNGDDNCDDDILLMDDPLEMTDSVNVYHNNAGGSELVNELSNNNICVGRVIQKTLMFLTNRIVIRGRFFIIGFYTLVLVGSCFLMAQLQPSTHPPQLFRPDTNIQRLLDLKANFSIIDTLHCDRCSGLYKVHNSYKHRQPDSPPSKLIPSPTDNSPTANENNLPDEQSRVHPSASPPTETATRATLVKPGPTVTPEDAPHPITKENILHRNDGIHSGQNNNNNKRGSEVIENANSLSGSLLKIANSSNSVINSLATALSYLLSSASSASATHNSKPVPSPVKNVDNYDKDAQGHQHTTAKPFTRKGTMAPLPLLPSGAPPERQPPNRGEPQHHNTGFRPEAKNMTSTDKNYNVCKEQTCGNLKDRPLMESGATVYVVFGIKGVNQSEEDAGHVLEQFKGNVVFDKDFADKINLAFASQKYLQELCTVCHILSSHTELVKEGSTQCLPQGMYKLRKVLSGIKECQDLPGSLSIYHHQAPAHAEGGVDDKGHPLWLAFAFESTTSEGQAYFQAYKQYMKWEELVAHIKANVLSSDSPLHSMFQTSEFWTKVLMEVVAVNSAIYGLVLSMLICSGAVAIFTGHIVLLLIIVITIIAMGCCVVGLFYLAGWEMGAVEAVSLSILVGSSVDYCVHIVEGFIVASKRIPQSDMATKSKSSLRFQRTSLAVRHIGVAIVCSALTTILAAVPLTQTFIQPFSKFGSILLLNTSVSLVMTLTLAVALLATFGPAHYKSTWKSHIIAFVATAGIVGAVCLAMYIASTQGVHIPGPSGSNLFT